MKLITKSAEHHFVTFLEDLKGGAHDWAAIYFALSKNLDHYKVIENPSNIQSVLNAHHKYSRSVFDLMHKNAVAPEDSLLYLFSDGDVVMLSEPADNKQRNDLQNLYTMVNDKIQTNYSDYGFLNGEIYNYQKLADEKFLTSKRFESYTSMTDQNKINSISVRREKRDHPLVMVVEDDRFTATYAANILNKDYDIQLCKTGEEAIQSYIDHAPDIVFLDIHLPGLSGHQVLQSIKAIDPDAHVIMLSVDTMKNNIVQSHHNGAHAFLKKPFSKERLVNMVKASPYIRAQIQKSANTSSSTSMLH